MPEWRNEYRRCDNCRSEYRPQREAQWFATMLLKSHVLHNPSSQPELLFGYVVASLTFKAGGPTMRDIRGDLQDRAKLIAEAISSVQAQLDNHSSGSSVSTKRDLKI